MELNPKKKIKCSCSQYISFRGMNKHLTTKSHINTSKKKEGIPEHRLNKFNQYKDEFNCCHKCYRTKIQIYTSINQLIYAMPVMRLS